MKILIINPPFYRLQGEMLIHYPPGCCYVAATLEDAGFDSLVYNADYDRNKKTILGNTNHINVKGLLRQYNEYNRRLHDINDPVWNEVFSELKEYNPDILIVSVFNTTLTAGNIIARMAKTINPKVVTIFEGCTNRGLHCAIDPAAEGDFSYMDVALRKEPEYTAVDVVKSIARSVHDLSDIPGVSWKNADGQIVHNEDRPYIEDLDSLPFPARHRLKDAHKIEPHCFQGIYGSRGCPYDCVFCGCHTSMGHRPRIRSAEDMVGEIEETLNRFGTRYFYICDDIFFIKKNRAHEFCRILINKKLPIYFSCQTRAELVDDITLDLVKRAGGQHIAVGVEVGNKDVRNLIKKGNTIEDVRNCAKLIRKNGLRMVAFVMVGLPWEGKEEIADTVNLIKEIDPYIVYPYMPTPAAGTELADIMSAKNPEGLKIFRDVCHINPKADVSERLDPEEKQKVLEWAMSEFVKVNRRSLLKDIVSRPGFYYALAHDMAFFNKPSLLLSYIKDYLS